MRRERQASLAPSDTLVRMAARACILRLADRPRLVGGDMLPAECLDRSVEEVLVAIDLARDDPGDPLRLLQRRGPSFGRPRRVDKDARRRSHQGVY
jgi:hypothetical protein